MESLSDSLIRSMSRIYQNGSWYIDPPERLKGIHNYFLKQHFEELINAEISKMIARKRARLITFDRLSA